MYEREAEVDYWLCTNPLSQKHLQVTVATVSCPVYAEQGR